MFDTPDDVRAYWQTVVDGPGTINMNGSGDIPVKMIKADTVEELVEKLGLPKDETLKTVEAYNGYCDAGVDEEFGKRKEAAAAHQEGPVLRHRVHAVVPVHHRWHPLQRQPAGHERRRRGHRGPVLPGLHGGTTCTTTATPRTSLVTTWGGTCLTFGYVTGP